jgi:hypothetical protein
MGTAGVNRWEGMVVDRSNATENRSTRRGALLHLTVLSVSRRVTRTGRGANGDEPPGNAMLK